jgi:cardiolipin synthase A/B
VLIEKYIFRFDRTGHAVLRALSEARARGVRVLLRVDGVGTRDEVPALADYCASHGIEFEVFHPLPFARILRRRGLVRLDSFLARWRALNRRSHRKLVLVDDETGFSGGRNVDDVESERRAGNHAWHDLSIRVEGSAMKRLVRAFWLWPFRKQPSRDFLLNYNWRLKRSRNTWFHRRIHEARRRLWIVTPYFAPTPAMLFQIRHAARLGADVRLVLPEKNDVALSQFAARALYWQILGWGVRVFEYQPKILHRKLWVIDELCVVGSGNLNHRSFMHDLEIDVILHQPAHVQLGAELFLDDQVRSREILRDDLARLPLVRRVLYWLASWLVYWL